MGWERKKRGREGLRYVVRTYLPIEVGDRPRRNALMKTGLSIVLPNQQGSPPPSPYRSHTPLATQLSPTFVSAVLSFHSGIEGLALRVKSCKLRDEMLAILITFISLFKLGGSRASAEPQHSGAGTVVCNGDVNIFGNQIQCYL